MPIVPSFQIAGETLTNELRVDGFEASQDTGKESLEVQSRIIWSEKVGNGDGGTGVNGVQADAKDDLVRAVGVDTLGEDTSNLDVGGLVSRLGGVEGIYSLSEDMNQIYFYSTHRYRWAI